MFESMTAAEKIEICDEQIRAVEALIYSQMINLSLDPSSVDPATVAVDSEADEGRQTSQGEIVAAMERIAFIQGIKTSLA